jgi:RNA polymerase sigma factor (sigma-70 family)
VIAANLRLALSPRTESSLDRIASSLREHDPEGLRAVIDAFGVEIATLGESITGSYDDGQDVLLKTLAIAWERVHQLQSDESLKPWLLRIATNESLRIRRRLRRDLEVSRRIPSLVMPDHSHAVVSRMALFEALQRLPPRMRAAVVLRYYADLPIAAVAEVLGRSPNTVRAQLQDAMRHLRTHLAPDNK